MEKNIKEAISIIEDVRKSMPECTNKAFLKGALNELNEALRLYAVSSSVCNKHSFKFKRLGTIGRKVVKCKNCGFIAN
jgi:predicted translin family RNA/ssDNA-binding protein